MRRICLTVLLLATGVVASGCAQLQTMALFEKTPKATELDPVAKIVGLWEPAEGLAPDGTPARGLAGKVMFFTRSRSVPVRVEGDVIIHQFDNMGTHEEQTEPIHTFRFDSGAWQIHLVDSPLGPAYNIFIPYMKKHGFEVECALRVKLETPERPPVWSEVTSIELEGAERADSVTSPAGETANESTVREFELTKSAPRRKALAERAQTLRSTTISPDTLEQSVTQADLIAEEKIRQMEERLARIAQQSGGVQPASYQK